MAAAIALREDFDGLALRGLEQKLVGNATVTDAWGIRLLRNLIEIARQA